MIIYQNQFKRISLPSLYLLFTIAILIVSIGKKGTDINYFLEATAGILLYAGISFNALLHKFNKNLLSFLFLLLLAQLLFINPVFKIRKHMQLERLAMPGISQAQRVYNYIKSSLGPVLVEDDEYAVFAGKTFFLNDSFNFSFLSRQGKWDMSDFLAMCERKEFTVIAFYWRYYSLPGLMQCIKRNYILIDEFDQERTLGTAWNPRLKVGLTSAYYHWKVFVPRN